VIVNVSVPDVHSVNFDRLAVNPAGPVSIVFDACSTPHHDAGATDDRHRDHIHRRNCHRHLHPRHCTRTPAQITLTALGTPLSHPEIEDSHVFNGQVGAERARPLLIGRSLTELAARPTATW
jgi:hypothetical protein